jgi:hypothetical protein
VKSNQIIIYKSACKSGLSGFFQMKIQTTMVKIQDGGRLNQQNLQHHAADRLIL